MASSFPNGIGRRLNGLACSRELGDFLHAGEIRGIFLRGDVLSNYYDYETGHMEIIGQTLDALLDELASSGHVGYGKYVEEIKRSGDTKVKVLNNWSLVEFVAYSEDIPTLKHLLSTDGIDFSTHDASGACLLSWLYRNKKWESLYRLCASEKIDIRQTNLDGTTFLDEVNDKPTIAILLERNDLPEAYERKFTQIEKTSNRSESWAGIAYVGGFILVMCVLAYFVSGYFPSGNRLANGESAGFFLGLVHGMFYPVIFVTSLFTDSVTVYETRNVGNWYDTGLFLGLYTWVAGAKKSVKSNEAR